MRTSIRAVVERFHLVFLRALTARGEDKSLFAVKGGCNLRFFFGSIRYSEDMDVDVAVVAKDTLRRRVDRLLESPTVRAPLSAVGVEIVEASAPKQTETTQRWKVGLRAGGAADPIRTKVEFSRRKALAGTAFERISPEVSKEHGLPPFAANHYATARAIEQKVEALAGRAEPQARDVFDLNLLLGRSDAPTATGADAETRARAAENALAISFAEYTAQVVAYLDPVQAEPYASREAWDTMQALIVEKLTEHGP